MTQERLEEIKNNATFIVDGITNKLTGVDLSNRDYSWLVSTVEEQADKIEAYENLKQTLEEFNHSQSEKIEEQQKEIEGLNEDLFYEQMQKEMFRKMIVENLKPSNVLLEKENARLREAIEEIKKKVTKKLEGLDAEEEMQRVMELSELMTMTIEALEE